MLNLENATIENEEKHIQLCKIIKSKRNRKKLFSRGTLTAFRGNKIVLKLFESYLLAILLQLLLSYL